MNILRALVSDPYAVWFDAAADSTTTKTEDGWVPVLIDGGDDAGITRVVAKLTGFPETVVGLQNSGTYFRTAYVLESSLSDVLAYLDAPSHSGRVKWELGLPFLSGDRVMHVPLSTVQTWNRQRTEQQQEQLTESPSTERTVIGIIDYGCAFAHDKVTTWSQGKAHTRVFAIWDQGHQAETLSNSSKTACAGSSGYQPLHWQTTAEFPYGAETRRDPPAHGQSPGLRLNEYINQFEAHGVLDDQRCYALSGHEPANAPVTHGTYIMDFAAGVPDPLASVPADAGYTHPTHDTEIAETDIVFVQLPRHFDGRQVSGLLRTYLLDAIQYIFSCAASDANVVINLSYGANAGPHDGSSVVERGMDALVDARRKNCPGVCTHLVVPSGNSRESEIHASAVVAKGKVETVQFGTVPDNPTVQYVECWFDGDCTKATIRVIPPGVGMGSVKGIPLNISSSRRINTVLRKPQGLLVVRPQKNANNKGSMALIVLHPTAYDLDVLEASKYTRSTPGAWRIEIDNNQGSGEILFNAWCEKDEPVFGTGSGPRQIRFLDHIDETKTLNSIAHGRSTVVVGGLVMSDYRETDYSAEGPARAEPVSRFALAHGETALAGPEVLAPSEENEAWIGLAGAGVLGRSTVRYPGTSVASAVLTRLIASNPQTWRQKLKTKDVRRFSTLPPKNMATML